MSIDQESFRKALGQFATGVTVVTGLDKSSQPVGMTVNAFSSLSLDPPMVLVCLDKKTSNIEAYLDGSHFVINILSGQQKDLSNLFATPRPDKFDIAEFETWDSGCPVLKGCLANIECRRDAIHDGGDHHILVGRVERLTNSSTDDPLLYFRSGYAAISNNNGS